MESEGNQPRESRVKKMDPDKMWALKQVDPEARFSPCWLR